MPFLNRPCGAKIYYEIRGKQQQPLAEAAGRIPVLLLAPGGMKSSLTNWFQQPYNPWKSLPESKFYLIGMDQRFANRSTGMLPPKISSSSSSEGVGIPSSVGWHTFLEDQLALLDHLNIDDCHLLGSCIGPSYAFQLIRHSPHRFGRCVMLQPIGLAQRTTESPQLFPKWKGMNHAASQHWFGDWADEMIRTQQWDPLRLKELYETMFETGRDFVYSISRHDASQITHTNLLVLMGRDMSHPSQISRDICELVPYAELVEEWRDAGPKVLAQAAAKIEAFLEADRLDL
jgi:pimeloyl-ACP methyl ester carboxylesterase